jgi:hypothetical protein
MSFTHIHSNTAKQAHAELLEALGSENNPSQWVEFMRTAHRHLPFLFEPGRPTKQQIENSAIGQLGFSSWAEMIEAERDKGGLDWSLNSWKLWSKSFKVINQYEYLAKMNITASAVMKLASDFRNAEFPSSKDELELARAAIAEKKKADETEKVSNLKARVIDLEKQLIAERTRVDGLRENQQDVIELSIQFSKLKDANAAFAENAIALEDKLKSQKAELEKAHVSLSMKDKELEKERAKKVSRFEHFKCFFTG